MPDISGLNGGVVKATPDATDLLPIQEVSGLTKPVSIASVATAAAALVPIATPSVAGKMSAADKTKLDGLGGGGGGGGTGSIGATTSGTNSATPAIGTIVTYTVVASSGLAVGQYYAFNGVSGTFLCTSTPSATTANFQNIDGTVGVAIADATKIIATGKTGATGTAGTNGTNGTNGINGTNGTGASGGVSSWQLKTTNYTALPGDKLRLDATASDIVITLPPTPNSTDADILFQRLELGANKVLLRSGANKFNTQSNQDGVFAPATTNSIEGVSYVNGAIGWLNQHNRLTFQAYVSPVSPTATDPLFSSVVLLMPMTTALGITDIKGKTTTNQGTTASTTRNDPFGNNVGVRDFGGGGARISVTPGGDFAFGSNAFAIEMWLYPTAIPTGTAWGILDARHILNAVDWLFIGNATGNIAFGDFSYPDPYYEFTSSPLILNQWNYICASRTATANHKVWINGVLVRAASTKSSNITAGNELLVGDIFDTSAPYDGSFTGSMSNLRITRAYIDGSIVPIAPFPTS